MYINRANVFDFVNEWWTDFHSKKAKSKSLQKVYNIIIIYFSKISLDILFICLNSDILATLTLFIFEAEIPYLKLDRYT